MIVATPKIMRDPETGASRGFGFVSYESFEASDAAIEAMSGQFLCNRCALANVWHVHCMPFLWLLSRDSCIYVAALSERLGRSTVRFFWVACMKGMLYCATAA